AIHAALPCLCCGKHNKDSGPRFRSLLLPPDQPGASSCGPAWCAVSCLLESSCRHEDPPAVGGDHGLWCCVAHDCCYYRLQKRGCGTKLLNYKFSYRGGKIICAKQDFCRSELCQCDKTAASCFARNRKTYSKKYQYYNNKSCRGKTPRC
uniref:Phospholipase A2 n=1 Tax=Equus asinus TaxID=9793 RepID=A0A9L0JZW5_EQUAS